MTIHEREEVDWIKLAPRAGKPTSNRHADRSQVQPALIAFYHLQLQLT